MAEEVGGVEVQVMALGDVPAGVEVTPAPTAPAAAIIVPLVPIEPTISPPQEPLPAPPTPPTPPTPAPSPAPAPVTEPTPPVEAKELTEYVGVPTEIGKGEYLGVIWADDRQHARNLAVNKFGGRPESYVLDIMQKYPKPYMCIRMEIEGQPTPYEPEKVKTIYNGLEFGSPLGEKIRLKCPTCLSEHYVPVGTTEFRCSIDGTILRVPDNIFKD